MPRRPMGRPSQNTTVQTAFRITKEMDAQPRALAKRDCVSVGYIVRSALTMGIPFL